MPPGFTKEETSIEISEMDRDDAIEFATEWVKTIDPDEKDSATYAFLSYVISALRQKPKSDFVESIINDLKECKQYIMFTSHLSENHQRRLTAINNAIMLLSGMPYTANQEPKTEQFAEWVAREIFNDEWEYNKDAFAELACRKLATLGIVGENGDEWELVESQEEVGEWILLDECSNSGYYCSKCKKKLVKEGWSDTVKKIKYCPNCGIPIKEVEK